MSKVDNKKENYVYHNLIKYHCFPCDKEFIISEYQRDKLKSKIICPYCHDDMVEAYVWMDDDLEDMEELAIGHYVDKY